MPAADPRQQARIVLRPIGSPLPLGLLGLFVATTMVSALQLEWIGDARAVGLTLVAFSAPVQLLAAVYGFLARDPVAGTGLAVSFGAWSLIGVELLTATDPLAANPTVGLFLCLAGCALLVPAVAGARGNPAPAVVLGITALRFLLGGTGELGAGDGFATASAITGLVAAAAALYAALASELEDAHSGSPLPLGRRGAGRAAVDGDLTDELEGIEHEAGVRRQL